MAQKYRAVDGVIWIERQLGQHHGYQSLKQLLLLLQFKVVHFLKMNSKLQKCHRHEKCFKNDISRRNAGFSPCRLPCLCPAQFSNKWALETISDPDFLEDFTQTPPTSFRPFPFSTVPIFPHQNGPAPTLSWGLGPSPKSQNSNTFLESETWWCPENLRNKTNKHISRKRSSTATRAPLTAFSPPSQIELHNWSTSEYDQSSDVILTTGWNKRFHLYQYPQHKLNVIVH